MRHRSFAVLSLGRCISIIGLFPSCLSSAAHPPGTGNRPETPSAARRLLSCACWRLLTPSRTTRMPSASRPGAWLLEPSWMEIVEKRYPFFGETAAWPAYSRCCRPYSRCSLFVIRLLPPLRHPPTPGHSPGQARPADPFPPPFVIRRLDRRIQRTAKTAPNAEIISPPAGFAGQAGERRKKYVIRRSRVTARNRLDRRIRLPPLRHPPT